MAQSDAGNSGRLYLAAALVGLALVIVIVKCGTSSVNQPCDAALERVKEAIAQNAWAAADLALPEARIRCNDRRSEVQQLEERVKAHASPGGTTAPLATSTSVAATCNANDRWFDHHLHGTPEENRAAFIREMAAWTPECRASAFQDECEWRCDDFISGMIIEASKESERAALYRWRLDKNKASLETGRTILAKVKKMRDYCQSIVGAPRGLNTECMTRMRIDFAAIDDLDREVQSKLGRLPIGFVALRGTLSFAKGCVDCSADNRWQCADMGQRHQGHRREPRGDSEARRHRREDRGAYEVTLA